jgi:hypothetical protein|nr:MAG TPA: hypothetical protein [Caudoviricetes sp.]
MIILTTPLLAFILWIFMTWCEVALILLVVKWIGVKFSFLNGAFFSLL